MGTVQSHMSYALGHVLSYSVVPERKAHIRSIKFFAVKYKIKMPRLSKEERAQAIGMLIAGASKIEVARRFGCTHAVVYRLEMRYRQTGSTLDRPRIGRPRVTTARQDRRIRVQHLRERFRTATLTASETLGIHNPRISSQTVINRLREHGIRCRRRVVGLVYTDLRRRNRVNWGNTYSQGAWRHRNWSRVVFSDESRFQLFRADGRQRVYKRVGERYARPCVRQVDRFGGGSVMVWGAIRFGWRSQLRIIDGNLTANRYIDTVLSPQVTPYMQHHLRLFLCMTKLALMLRTCVFGI